HLLVKLGADPVRLVEKFKAQASTAHAAFGRGRETSLVELCCRNTDLRSVGCEIEGNLRLREDLPRLARVLGLHACVESAPVCTQCVPEQRSGQRGQQQRGDGDAVSLPRSKTRPADTRASPHAGETVGPLRLAWCSCRRVARKLCRCCHNLGLGFLSSLVDLKLHPDHRLIRLHRLVAHCQRKLEGHISFFSRDHRLMYIDTMACHQSSDGCLGLLFQL